MDSMDIAIEIGVQDAIYTKYLASHFKNVIGIDPYHHYPSEYYHDGSNLNQETLDYNYNKVSSELERDYKNISLIRDESLKCIDRFEDNSIDFIYLDGNHMYHYVIQELEAWWPKIKEGGVFGGHDYGNYKDEFTTIEVEKAVKEWASKLNILDNIIACHHHNGCGSWFIKKQKDII
jgi:hypothetical protein